MDKPYIAQISNELAMKRSISEFMNKDQHFFVDIFHDLAEPISYEIP